MDFFCGFMVVESGVAMVWFDFDFDFVGCRGCWSLWLGFLGFQENNSLGMFFVVVVAASDCRGDLSFEFLFLFGFWDILFYCIEILF